MCRNLRAIIIRLTPQISGEFRRSSDDERLLTGSGEALSLVVRGYSAAAAAVNSRHRTRIIDDEN